MPRFPMRGGGGGKPPAKANTGYRGKATSFKNAVSRQQQNLPQPAPPAPSPQDDGSGYQPAPTTSSPGGSGGGGGDYGAPQAGQQDQRDEQEQSEANDIRQQQQGSDSTSQQDDGEAAFIQQMQEQFAAQQDDANTPESASESATAATLADISGEDQPRFCSYVQDGRLCTLGLVPSGMGPIPLVSMLRAKGAKNGIVNIGVDPNLDQAIQTTMASIMDKAEKEKVRAACAELVERSRQGDQVAMGTIARVRENARQGHKRARIAYSFLADYVKTHPIDGAATMAGEPNMRTAVQLANGPSITKERIDTFVSTFGYGHSRGGQKRQKQAIIHGIANFGAEIDPEIAKRLDRIESGLAELGRTIGMAFGIQRVRQPNSRISGFSEMAGWELGE